MTLSQSPSSFSLWIYQLFSLFLFHAYSQTHSNHHLAQPQTTKEKATTYFTKFSILQPHQTKIQENSKTYKCNPYRQNIQAVNKIKIEIKKWAATERKRKPTNKRERERVGCATSKVERPWGRKWLFKAFPWRRRFCTVRDCLVKIKKLLFKKKFSKFSMVFTIFFYTLI